VFEFSVNNDILNNIEIYTKTALPPQEGAEGTKDMKKGELIWQALWNMNSLIKIWK